MHSGKDYSRSQGREEKRRYKQKEKMRNYEKGKKEGNRGQFLSITFYEGFIRVFGRGSESTTSVFGCERS